MTTRIQFDELMVCEDCYLAAAGYTAEELGYTPEVEPLSRVEQPFLSVVPHDEEKDEDFSASPCEGCGSTLAGARHSVAVLHR